MPIYEFACDVCDLNLDFELSMAQSGSTMSCPTCGKDMRRVYYAPRLLNRQKPGSFVYNPKTMNGDDDRLHNLRDVEQRGGTAGLRKVRGEIGEALYHQVLNHKKENYA